MSKQVKVDNVRKKRYNADGWFNALASLGKQSDKTRVTQFGEVPTLVDDELTRMWIGEGFGKKIVGAVADDMTRNWINIAGDSKNEIQKELTRLDSEKKVNEALKWARLYRGSLVVVGAQDGGKLSKPLNIERIKGIDWLKVYPASRIPVSSTNLVRDPKSPFFEELEFFDIHKRNGGIIKVHASRCLIFKGEPVPDTSRNFKDEHTYWGMSILQSIWHQLSNYGAVEQSLVNLLMEAVIGKYTFSNLAEILSQNKTDDFYTRMEIINASKSIINAVILGEGEEYTRDSANFAGLPEMVDRFMMNLSAVSEIPVTRLFGRSPAGQNATGESDLRTYYDMVSSKQKTWLKPPLQHLVDMMNVYLNVTDEPEIDFNPVWEPTQKELIEMKKSQAETDQIYMNNGVLSDEEVRENRFANGFSFETTVEGDITQKEIDNPPTPPILEGAEE